MTDTARKGPTLGAPLFVGLVTLDISYALDSYPAEDTKTQANDHFLGAGGPAANAAVACAAVSDGPATLITALGTGELTDTVRRDLRAQHVDIVDTTPERAGLPPVSSIVVALEAQSRTVVSRDAADIDATYDPKLASSIDRAPIVLLDGHHGDLALGVAARAAEWGIPVVLDAGRWKDIHAQLLPLVDTVICSSTFRPPGLDDDTDVLDHLLAAGPRRVAVTRGPESIRYATADLRGEIPVNTVAGADTLGAGDILHGAFCAYYTRSRDFVEALGRAAMVATLSCRSFGTRDWRTELAEQPQLRQ